MKFNIVAKGHNATVEIAQDGKGGFTGTIVSPDFGTGAITNGVQTDQDLKGSVSLDGYDPDFTATLAGANISGALKYGWFFNESFSGTQAA